MMEGSAFPRIDISPKSGSEPFLDGESKLEVLLSDFWRWSCSDLVNNVTRGVLAEFLVASALGLSGGARQEWESHDLTTKSGIKIEVKSAAYVQSWHQKKPSMITFGIAPRLHWNADTGSYGQSKKRHADVYVFCLLEHAYQASINPMDVSQWVFFVLATSVLDKKLSDQKQVALGALLELKPEHAIYDTLAKAVENAAAVQIS